MSDAADQPVENVTNKADKAVLGAFAPGVDTSVDYSLQVEGLEKSFSSIATVDGATFEAESRTLTGLIGPNRAGKSMTFNLIADMLRPDADTVTFNGEDTTGEGPRQIVDHEMVRAFQIARELSKMTVPENMMLMPEHQRGETLWRSVMPGVHDDVREQEAELLERVREVLDSLDIAHIAEEYAGNLSGEQHKLFEMVRVLLTDPDTLFLDGPFARVNPMLEKRLLECVCELHERGHTLLLIEHDMDLITNNCEHVIVLHQGSILMKGTPDEIRNNEGVIGTYLGDSV